MLTQVRFWTVCGILGVLIGQVPFAQAANLWLPLTILGCAETEDEGPGVIVNVNYTPREFVVVVDDLGAPLSMNWQDAAAYCNELYSKDGKLMALAEAKDLAFFMEYGGAEMKETQYPDAYIEYFGGNNGPLPTDLINEIEHYQDDGFETIQKQDNNGIRVNFYYKYDSYDADKAILPRGVFWTESTEDFPFSATDFLTGNTVTGEMIAANKETLHFVICTPAQPNILKTFR